MSVPGLSPERVAGLMRRAIAETGLDLRGTVVLTEAATGAYGVTPVIAALAGARRVHAVARDSRHGSAADARDWVTRLAQAAGAAPVIDFHAGVPRSALPEVDIVTNSGHVRPIDAALVAALPARAVVALMFEAWEWREGDVDLAACRRRGIPVVGVNERHPAVGVFAYLGPLCVRLLQDAGIPVLGSRIALVCDNDFGSDIARGLTGLGARLEAVARVEALAAEAWDAVVIALTPGAAPRIDAPAAAILGRRAPGAVLAQFWGDVDRPSVEAAGLLPWPPAEPKPGHMGVLLSQIGPDPIVRLQTGGLKAAETVMRGGMTGGEGFAQVV